MNASNIMVERLQDGATRAVLMDFGLARTAGHGITMTGEILGTPAYMSPEQGRGETRSLDGRTDVYSLGATLYELLCGQPPLQAATVFELLIKLNEKDPPLLRTHDPSIPESLETIVSKCLHKDPARRYLSAQALADDLGRYLFEKRIAAKKESLFSRLMYRARRNKLVSGLALALVASVLALLSYGSWIRLQSRRAEERARELAQTQAALSERLGREIKDMEWLLRTARAMPLHDLEREKKIVRQRMAVLQKELADVGAVARPLAHYALGRGHMALHEYPEARNELESAIALGYTQAEAHYALGVVLGKHFEQAMYEARLSGSGEWATRKRKAMEPKYLLPAIAALERSRSLKLDAPAYLEALIAYYRDDFDVALSQADRVLAQAPWMYEASKLAGDIHHERALRHRDRGSAKDPSVEKEFSAAVRSYEQAALIAPSDGEIYEALAETWIRVTETGWILNRRDAATEAAARAAADKLLVVEPRSFAANFKQASVSFGDAVRCAEWGRKALLVQPDHPYTVETVANCEHAAAIEAEARGEGDSLSKILLSRQRLQTLVNAHPEFLWGHNDLGTSTIGLAEYGHRHGREDVKETIAKALSHFEAAVAIDAAYPYGLDNYLNVLPLLVLETSSETELQGILAKAEAWFARCIAAIPKETECFNNRFRIYAYAAQRTLLRGGDPQPRLQQALAGLSDTLKLNDALLDSQQAAVVAHLTDARDRLRRRLDPSAALVSAKRYLDRCFTLASENTTCQTLQVQIAWAEAEWVATLGRPAVPLLQKVLPIAQLATRDLLLGGDAWHILAETHLRIARSPGITAAVRSRNISDGLTAAASALAKNPRHGHALATQGALLLLSFQTQHNDAAGKQKVQSAIAAFEQAVRADAFLEHSVAPLLIQAKQR